MDVRDSYRARLQGLKEAITACRLNITGTGLARDDVTELVNVADQISCPLPQLDPLVSERVHFQGERSYPTDRDGEYLISLHEQ